MNEIIRSLEALAVGTVATSSHSPLTPDRVAEARVALSAPAVMACMIVAPPLPVLHCERQVA